MRYSGNLISSSSALAQECVTREATNATKKSKNENVMLSPQREQNMKTSRRFRLAFWLVSRLRLRNVSVMYDTGRVVRYIGPRNAASLCRIETVSGTETGTSVYENASSCVHDDASIFITIFKGKRGVFSIIFFMFTEFCYHTFLRIY